MEDTLEAAFKIDPEALASGISEVQSDVPRAGSNKNNRLYVAAIGGSTALAGEQMIAESAGRGRIVLGMAGTGHNHVFFDLPAISVSEPGEFVCKRADNLKTWAQACTDVAEIEYHVNKNQFSLSLYHGEGSGRGSKEMEVQTNQDPGQIQQVFPAKEHRFGSPSEEFTSEPVADMLSKASDLAPKKSSEHRTGDLLINGGQVEFVTKEIEAQHSVTTRQRVEADLPIENLEWEVAPEHLSVLEETLRGSETTAEYNDAVGAGKGKKGVLQIEYPKEVGHSDRTGWVHRQLHIFREEEPLKDWFEGASEEDFFGHDQCRLFSSVVVRPFLQALTRTWAIEPTATVEAEPTEDQSQLLLKSGNPKDPDEEYVQATVGDSQINSYIFDPHGIEKIETMADDKRMLQFLSHPSEKGELPNAFIAVPCGDDDHGPTEIPEDPDRYVIVFWSAA